MESYSWYQTLIKPEWAPPASWFGPVWTALYAVIAVTYLTVFLKAWKGSLPKRVVLPFAFNLIFNFAFTYIQFGLKNNLLASLDIILVLLTLIWAMKEVWHRLRWVAIANTPYLLWVSFATVLQLTVTYLNS